MAIKIPSRNIYEKDNDKIRDNKIDRIEVSAKEVLPNNEYETPVYNEKSDIGSFESSQYPVKEEKHYRQIGQDYATAIYAFYKIESYKNDFNLTLQKNKDNKYISKILYSYKENSNGEIDSDIGVSIIAKKYVGTIQTSITNIGNDSFQIIYQTPYYPNEPTEERYENMKPSLKYDYKNESGSQQISVAQNDFINPDGRGEIAFTEFEDSYNLSFSIFSGYEEVKGGGYYEYDKDYTTGKFSPSWEEKKSECVKIVPTAIEITVYGNTIGIDLQDKIIYVPNQDGSKPFSVEGNELMQTSNNFVSVGQQLVRFSDYTIAHLDDRGNDINNDGKDYDDWDYGFGATVIIKNPDFYGNELAVRIFGEQDTTTFHDVKFTPTERQNSINVDNDGYYMGKVEVYENRISSIKSSFNKTLNHYAKGKETATLRCSISDYYDENGEKVIATNNSNKMAFDIYDEVIPYSYGADGNDKPLSRHKDGSPKTFVVLGTRIFYDGAVWQELTLQEK